MLKNSKVHLMLSYCKGERKKLSAHEHGILIRELLNIYFKACSEIPTFYEL